MKTNIAFLAVAAGVCVAPRAEAQMPGTFTATGSMTTPRVGHTATLLQNGKVLIAGGWLNVPGGQHCEGSLDGGSLDCVSRLNSAELYDPKTGTFRPTAGTMEGLGLFHTATLLPNGMVLILWGNSAELYDPSTELFRAIDGVFPGGALATLLNNGKVLINGPWPPALTGFPALLYDPANGTFLPTGDYAGTPGSLGPAALLPDGRVMVVGNVGCCYDSGQTEVYDPSSDTFSLTIPIFPQSNATMITLLETGKVLAVGGGDVNDDDYNPIGAGLYDPASGTFVTIGNMTFGREGETVTLLPDGTVLIAGGSYTSPSSTEVYDPAAQRFSAGANMVSPRMGPTATLLPDGRVLVAGGFPNSPATTATAELYTPQLQTPAPALFSLSGDGAGQGAIWHGVTGSIASSANPATAGDALAMYTTSLFEGGAIPPQVAIGGQAAEVLFFGDAPGYPGYYQVNFRVPNGVAPGPAATVRLTYLGRASNEVTIGVQ